MASEVVSLCFLAVIGLSSVVAEVGSCLLRDEFVSNSGRVIHLHFDVFLVLHVFYVVFESLWLYRLNAWPIDRSKGGVSRMV